MHAPVDVDAGLVLALEGTDYRVCDPAMSGAPTDWALGAVGAGRRGDCRRGSRDQRILGRHPCLKKDTQGVRETWRRPARPAPPQKAGEAGVWRYAADSAAHLQARPARRQTAGRMQVRRSGREGRVLEAADSRDSLLCVQDDEESTRDRVKTRRRGSSSCVLSQTTLATTRKYWTSRFRLS